MFFDSQSRDDQFLVRLNDRISRNFLSVFFPRNGRHRVATGRADKIQTGANDARNFLLRMSNLKINFKEINIAHINGT